MNEKVYVPGVGNIGAKLAIVGEAPSYAETEARKPFVGPSGRELDKLLKEAGINRSECWITNIFKYEIPANPKGKRIPVWIRAQQIGLNVDEQLNELRTELISIKPNCILMLGASSLWGLTGKTKIGDLRGSIILTNTGIKGVGTYHPAHLLHGEGEIKGYWNRNVMIFDFQRALYQSKFPELILPQRILQICRSSYDLMQFRDRYKNQTKMAVDIEAHGSCIPICIGLSLNKSHGMVVPLWNKDDISSIPDNDLVQCWIILAEMLYEKEIIGQNFNYDRDKIRRLGFIISKLKSDVMMKSFAINPELPKNLAFNTSIYTEEPFYKNEGMYEGRIEDLLTGCARDACVTLEIDEAMDKDLDELNQRKFYENFLMKLPELYLSIENQGFGIDEKMREHLLRKYIRMNEENQYELFKLTGTEINVNSPKQVWSLLFDNLKFPQRKGTGEEELTSLLNLQSFTNEDHRKIVERILEGRRIRKAISTYLMALPDFDNRMRTTYFPCLETGRTSTGQQDPPIRPSIEVIDENGKKKKKVLGMAFQTISKHGEYSDVREIFIP